MSLIMVATHENDTMNRIVAFSAQASSNHAQKCASFLLFDKFSPCAIARPNTSTCDRYLQTSMQHVFSDWSRSTSCTSNSDNTSSKSCPGSWSSDWDTSDASSGRFRRCRVLVGLDVLVQKKNEREYRGACARTLLGYIRSHMSIISTYLESNVTARSCSHE